MDSLSSKMSNRITRLYWQTTECRDSPSRTLCLTDDVIYSSYSALKDVASHVLVYLTAHSTGGAIYQTRVGAALVTSEFGGSHNPITNGRLPLLTSRNRLVSPKKLGGFTGISDHGPLDDSGEVTKCWLSQDELSQLERIAGEDDGNVRSRYS
jgi:hypothetical protein